MGNYTHFRHRTEARHAIPGTMQKATQSNPPPYAIPLHAWVHQDESSAMSEEKGVSEYSIHFG